MHRMQGVLEACCSLAKLPGSADEGMGSNGIIKGRNSFCTRSTVRIQPSLPLTARFADDWWMAA